MCMAVATDTCVSTHRYGALVATDNDCLNAPMQTHTTSWKHVCARKPHGGYRLESQRTARRGGCRHVAQGEQHATRYRLQRKERSRTENATAHVHVTAHRRPRGRFPAPITMAQKSMWRWDRRGLGWPRCCTWVRPQKETAGPISRTKHHGTKVRVEVGPTGPRQARHDAVHGRILAAARWRPMCRFPCTNCRNTNVRVEVGTPEL